MTELGFIYGGSRPKKCKKRGKEKHFFCSDLLFQRKLFRNKEL
jgi:hypothetical protein